MHRRKYKNIFEKQNKNPLFNPPNSSENFLYRFFNFQFTSVSTYMSGLDAIKMSFLTINLYANSLAFTTVLVELDILLGDDFPRLIAHEIIVLNVPCHLIKCGVVLQQ